MKKLLLGWLLAGLILAGCGGRRNGVLSAPPAAAAEPTVTPATGDGATTAAGAGAAAPRAQPECFPFKHPQSSGPAATYGWKLQGPQPLYPGAPIRVVGRNWATGSNTVRLLLIPPVTNAWPYGRRSDLATCLAPVTTSLGEVALEDGQFVWEGQVPTHLHAGDRPWLVAVATDSTYFAQPLQQYGAEALVQPYGLIAHDPALDGGGLAPAVLPVALGQPFVLQGSTWSMKDGQVAMHLEWERLGDARVQLGRISSQGLVIPPDLKVNGQPLVVPGEYELEITSPERPYALYHTLTVRVLPPPGNASR